MARYPRRLLALEGSGAVEEVDDVAFVGLESVGRVRESSGTEPEPRSSTFEGFERLVTIDRVLDGHSVLWHEIDDSQAIGGKRGCSNHPESHPIRNPA